MEAFENETKSAFACKRLNVGMTNKRGLCNKRRPTSQDHYEKWIDKGHNEQIKFGVSTFERP